VKAQEPLLSRACTTGSLHEGRHLYCQCDQMLFLKVSKIAKAVVTTVYITALPLGNLIRRYSSLLNENVLNKCFN